MKIQVKSGKPETEKTEVLVLATFEGKLSKSANLIDKKLNGILQKALKTKEFKGELNETFFSNTFGKIPARKILLIGLGKEKEFETDNIRQAAGTAAAYIRDSNIKSFTLTIPETKIKAGESAQTLVEGVLLGSYQFTKFKTENRKDIKKLDGFTLLCSKKDLNAVKSNSIRAQTISDAVIFVRDLVNEPSNYKTPELFAKIARQAAGKNKLRIKIFDKKGIEKLKMGGLLGVSSGSGNPPRFLVLEYNPGKKGTIVLVGKGVTFDAGGLDLKPWRSMWEMKSDMGGAAAVLGTMITASKLKLPLHLIGLLPITENVIGGFAMKPGDVLKNYSGKTIEVINTDAEGRLILADALAYAGKYKPKAVVDLATLTGACIVALGYEASGLLGTDKKLIEKIKKAGEKSGDRVWELPLWKEYSELMKSEIADVRNIAVEGSGAGAITAAAFLKNFVKDYSWAHLDIAGPAYIIKPKPYAPKGATGAGVRLLVQFLSDWKK